MRLAPSRPVAAWDESVIRWYAAAARGVAINVVLLVAVVAVLWVAAAELTVPVALATILAALRASGGGLA